MEDSSKRAIKELKYFTIVVFSIMVGWSFADGAYFVTVSILILVIPLLLFMSGNKYVINFVNNCRWL